MIFLDYEVTEYDWLVVLIDMDKQTETIIHNDRQALTDYYNRNKDEIWVGFNINHYDKYIQQCILSGLNPKQCSDFIIAHGLSGYNFSPLLKNFPMITYDVMERTDRGLKTFEGFMGNDIRETTVDFNIDRPWTEDELKQMIYYCRHDVTNTIEVFIERQSDFFAQMDLINMFKFPLTALSRTKVQLSAEILEAERHDWEDEFDIHLPDCAIVKKYKTVPDWFSNPISHCYKIGNKSNQLKLIMAGIPMVFGWGGVHGAIPNFHSKGFFLNMDVSSLYPSIDCLYPEFCFSRSVPPEGLERYKWILNHRLELKAQDKKKEQAPLKIVLNGTYGAMKDKYNKLYDPRSANNTCVFGQILVGVDLLERLEETGVCQIIQVNTDGILIKMDRYEDYDLIDDVASEWEKRTGLDLEFDDYGWGEIFQKDVNNYVIIDGYDGHFKSKGAYVKPWLDKDGNPLKLDYDCVILRKALIDYMVKGIPVEKTINDCDDLKEFQMVKKISGKYKNIKHGEEILTEKCIRVFASRKYTDRSLWKKHAVSGNYSKLEGTPNYCFIYNDSVEGVKVLDKLDKEWYILEAEKRLEGFGVKNQYELSL